MGHYHSNRPFGQCRACPVDNIKPAIPGKRRCAECTEKAKNDRIERINNGLCTMDGCNNKAAPGKRRCQSHIDKAFTYRARHIAKGKCRQCSKEAMPGFTSCIDHLIKDGERIGSKEKAEPLRTELVIVQDDIGKLERNIDYFRRHLEQSLQLLEMKQSHKAKIEQLLNDADNSE